MEGYLKFAVYAFTTLFSIVNPIGAIPVFSSMTIDIERNEVKKVALKSTILATATMLAFAILGELILKFFGISIASFKIVGGVIFFMMGHDMLQAKISKTKMTKEEEKAYSDDIAITPLAIPMLCGPGAITTAIVLMGEAGNLTTKAIVVAVILLIGLTSYLSLISGKKLLGLLGESGSKIVLRLMGLIVMVIAVEYITSGVQTKLREIFKIK